MTSTPLNWTSDHKDQYLEASGANLYFLSYVLKNLPEFPNKKCFLEIGCGTGVFSYCLALASGWQAFGTELSPSAMAIASSRIQCHLVSNIILPFPDNFFSAVIAKDVLPMIPEKTKWFKEIYRVLDYGGVFVSYFPSEQDFGEKPLYGLIPKSLESSKKAYGTNTDTLFAMQTSGFQNTKIDRLYLGTVHINKQYMGKHNCGFFNNTDGITDESRYKSLAEASDSFDFLFQKGLTAHYEWERTGIVGRKS